MNARRLLALVPLVILVQAATGPDGWRPPKVEQQVSGTTARLQAVWAVDERVVWASGTRGTFTRTTDGGTTWRAGTVPGADSLEFRDVHAFDADHAVLLAAGPGDKSRLYRTADGGRTWALTFVNEIKARFYDCIDFQGETGYAVSDAAAGIFPLLRTSDGGRTWTPWNPPGADALAPADGEGGFAASGTCLTIHPDGGVWIGTAGGARAIRFGGQGTVAFPTPIVRGQAAGIASVAFRNAAVGMAAGGDLGRADAFLDNVAVTSDGGKTWTVAARPPFPGAVFGVAYVPSRPETVVAVAPKGAAWSDDNGKTWAMLDGNDYWGISFTTSGVGWIAGPRGRIAKVTF